LANQDLTDTRCNIACPGDASDSCGQSGWISVYYDPTKYTAGANPALYGPQTPQTVGNYVLQGCYSEATTGRALSGQAPTAPTAGFTLELCEAACQGYTYWGIEYSNQCYCGNSLGTGSMNQSSLVPSVSGCNMLCRSIPVVKHFSSYAAMANTGIRYRQSKRVLWRSKQAQSLHA
jgi:hypothetical protein